MAASSFSRLPVEDRFLEAIEDFEPAARKELLMVLTSSGAVRTDLIRQFWEREEGHPNGGAPHGSRGGPGSPSGGGRPPPGEPPIA